MDSAMHDQVKHHGVERFRVLLVEDCATDAESVRLALGETRDAGARHQERGSGRQWNAERGRGKAEGGVHHSAFIIHHSSFGIQTCRRLKPALRLLAREHFDVVLLDLGLPDSAGTETLDRVRAAAPDVPLVVLAGLDDDGLALTAIQRGAQDYLAKDRLDGHLLRRTLRHAIERKRAEVQLLRRSRQIETAHAQIQRQAAQLKLRAEQLDRINRELDDFAYIASHDLKEPLRGIRAYCEILLEDYHAKLDTAGQRRLATLVELCGRLETLIGDLLTYGRIGRAPAEGGHQPKVGRGRPADTGIDLGAVVDKVLDMLRPAIDRRGASVRVLGRLPKVTGDATLIGMVLTNLISNGLKFNRRAHPQVEIGCLRATGGASATATFYVRDDGIGIDPRHHEAIFTIFRRLHSRKQYEGTGAGLTIVRKIVRAHGGRIWVESALGAGSTFFFTLAPSDDKSPCAAGGASTTKTTTKPPHFQGKRGQDSFLEAAGTVS
jgi:signal transduction histidine kinase